MTGGGAGEVEHGAGAPKAMAQASANTRRKKLGGD